ncbi:MAG: hypothetical protein CSB33_01930 [Desulfobacterales bacterium]|nr:MAG: hypothetical protein CSB33_01930 [Desulfobacterales bacterium]
MTAPPSSLFPPSRAAEKGPPRLLREANAHMRAGRWAEAESGYRRLLKEIPPSEAPRVMASLGAACRSQGKRDEALHFLESACKLQPDNPRFSANLGAMLYEAGRLDEARRHLESTLARHPDAGDVLYNLGLVNQKEGRLADAVRLFRTVLEIKPDYAGAFHNLGAIFMKQGRFKAAETEFRQALRLRPDYHKVRVDRALMYLLTGDRKQGRDEYEYRYRLNGFPDALRPLWDGRPLPGKTLYLMAEQGLGDTLQFIRYVPLARRRCGRILFQCPPLLKDLLADFPGVDQQVDRITDMPFDAGLALLSLPRLLDDDPDAQIMPPPYLTAPVDRLSRWEKAVAAPGFHVGLVWAGNPAHQTDWARSLHLTDFAALADIPGVIFHGLQKGQRAGEVHSPPPGMDIRPDADRFSDFRDTAALVHHLDLVICVDTSVAHLAGAMGKETWTLLPYIPDWRWGLEGEKTGWYPQMRLYRQKRPGGWDAVFRKLAADLMENLADRTRSAPVRTAAPPVPQRNHPPLTMPDAPLPEQGPSAAGTGISARIQEALHLLSRRDPKAVPALEKLTAALPGRGDLRMALGMAHWNRNDAAAALSAFAAGAGRDPGNPEIRIGMGNALRELNRNDEARAAYEAALSLKVDHVEALKGLALCHADDGRLEEAVRVYETALVHAPADPEIRLSIGNTQKRMADFTAARREYEAVIYHWPDYARAHLFLGLLDFLEGRFEEGAEKYEWRWKTPSMRREAARFSSPVWDGGPLNGCSLLVHAEQGLGDTLQFARLLPELRTRGAGRIILSCDPPLFPLLESIPGVDRVVDRNAPPPPADQRIPLMSLVFRMGISPADPPESVRLFRYKIPADPLKRWRDRLRPSGGDSAPDADHSGPPPILAGLCWAGNPKHARDRQRSIPVSALRTLLEVPGITWLIFQKEARHRTALDELAASLPAMPDIRHIGDDLTDFAESAAALAAADLLLTVDTAMAHLAGGTGCPAWTLLPFIPDWRWGLEKEDAPWYPEMRLFRQGADGRWAPVLERAAKELSRFHSSMISKAFRLSGK